MKRGRKSKYDIEINKSKVWNVAVYIRLSVQDGDKAESNSVINQKKLLNMYLEQDKELNVILMTDFLEQLLIDLLSRK